MIRIKSPAEIKLMQKAGEIAELARRAAGEAVQPGITTREIAEIAGKVILACGAKPSFLGYGGFEGIICISINEEVIHGIPGRRKIKDGDMVKLDVGAYYGGYHGDCAATYFAGTAGEQAQKLAQVTRQSFYEGIRYARAGGRVSDISHAIQTYCESLGYSLVRDYVGHGVGSELHEAPEVPNFGPPGRGPRLVPGMTLAIEPMVNAGGHEVRRLRDGWTVVTADGSLSGHYENTILITEGEPLILTADSGGKHE